MKRLLGLKTQTAGELLDREFSARQMLLDPWLRSEETCVIWAATGVGKTMFSLSLAAAVAGGGRLGDWQAPKAQRVVYIDGEMNIRDLQERLDLMINKIGLFTDQAGIQTAKNNLTLIARQDQEKASEFLDITRPDHQVKLIESVSGSCDLLILDNFTTLSMGLDDENDATAFKQVQDLFMELKREGVSTILVHHANKGGRSMRGSTALEATFEVIIGLQKPKVSAAGEARFRVEFTKYRSKGDDSLTPRIWALTTDGWQVADDALDDPKEDKVYVAVKSLDYVSLQEVADALNMSKSAVHRRCDKLDALGALTRTERVECFRTAKALKQPEGHTPFDVVGDEEF